MLKRCKSSVGFAQIVSPHSILSLRRSFQSNRTFFTGQLLRSENSIMGKDKDKEKLSFQLKTPKGCRDWAGKDIVIRNKIFSIITDVFEGNGGETIDTPVFELKDVLTEKYGEDSKLIYDLEDQGGEKCSLRYDLTVPFARYLAMNPNVPPIKRWQIAKVYRRDQPAMAKGRMREFYQCDFDIAGGTNEPMWPDAQIVYVVYEVFERLGWQGKYRIKINNRAILDGIFEVCGVPEDKIRAISSAVDKLDKLPWEEVKREMIEDKKLDLEVADRIWGYVQRRGGEDVLWGLRKDNESSHNKNLAKGIEEMERLFGYLKVYGTMDKIDFDLSLARGLDYYTGVIFEVVTEGSAPSTTPGQKSQRTSKKDKGSDFEQDLSNDPSVGIGSVAAGGRYDGLVGMFSGKAIPCVGIAFGLDRIFSVMKARMEAQEAAERIRTSKVDVFLMAFGGNGFTNERIEVFTMLRAANIKVELMSKEKPKLPAQFKAADTKGIPFAVILAEEELAQGKVKIKEMGLPEGNPEKEGVMVDLKELVRELQVRLQAKATRNDFGSITASVKRLSLLEQGPKSEPNGDGI